MMLLASLRLSVMILTVLSQARCQDLAAGRAKIQKVGPNFSNTVLDVCSNWGAKCEMGGPGTTGPPRW